MSIIYVYFEGPSDKFGMEELFADVTDRIQKEGKSLSFHYLGGKEQLLKKGPVKALRGL